MEEFPKVYIILVNYDSWKETIDCLESLLVNNYEEFEVVVVDNNSSNESIQEIEKWLREDDNENTKYTDYQSAKNQLKFASITQKCISVENRKKLTDIIFISSKVNTGFAGGNNIALEYIHRKGDAEYVWLLNNDTIVDKQSLLNQIRYFQKNNNNKKIGVLGSKVRYYHEPELIQCIGGSSYNRWTGYSKQIGNKELDRGQYDVERIVPKLIIGACMLLSKEFLSEIKYLDENYFLYFEEQDIAKVASDRNFLLDYTVDSVIYHKEGRTIGAKTLFSDFYYNRSKIIFTYKHYSFLNKFSIRLSLLFTIVNRLRAGKIAHVPLLIRIMIMPIERLKKTTYEAATI